MNDLDNLELYQTSHGLVAEQDKQFHNWILTVVALLKKVVGQQQLQVVQVTADSYTLTDADIGHLFVNSI